MFSRFSGGEFNRLFKKAWPPIRERSMKEQELVEETRQKLRMILKTRKDIVMLACQQRSKFEGWLKFELAGALNRDLDIQNVIFEGGYSDGKRADITFSYCGTTCIVEMKTSNTNWRAEGIEKRTRPIKMNIDSIIEDILMLQAYCAPHMGLMIFLLFPVPSRTWKDEKEKISYHLRRIEAECELPKDSVTRGADYIEMNENFGVCTFLVPVHP